MSSDSETLALETESIPKEKENGDFPSIGVDLLKKINFKVAIFLFLIGAFILSDIFIENALPRKYINGDCADTSGTMIQLLCLVLAYLIIDLIVQGGLL